VNDCQLPEATVNDLTESRRFISLKITGFVGLGDMSQERWQKVLDFSVAAGIVKDCSKFPSAQHGLLWTNKYASK
jgi:hypothetical protein